MRCCDFCRKTEHKVSKLIERESEDTKDYEVHICDQCVKLCVEVLLEDSKTENEPCKS